MQRARVFRSLYAASAWTLLAGTTVAAPGPYSIDILIAPSHAEIFDSWLFGINNQGETTGYTVTRNPANQFVQSAVTYRAGATQVLASGPPGGLGTSGLAINEGGDVLGNSSGQLTFFAAGAPAAPITVPGFDFPTVRGLNAAGSVLLNDFPSDLYYGAERFAVWQAGASTRIAAIESLYPYTLPPDPNDFNSGPSTTTYSRRVTGINSAGQFAASVITLASFPGDPNDPNDDTFTEEYAHAYVFNGHGGFSLLEPPAPGVEIDPIAIDAAGTVLGWAGDQLALWGSDGAVESLLPDPGASLKHIGGFGYSSLARNGLGQIVAITAASGIVFYDPTTNAWTDITGSIDGLGIGTFSTIQGFNDWGQFVGLVRPPQGGGVFGCIVTPLPEPATLPVFALPLLIAAISRRRNTRDPSRVVPTSSFLRLRSALCLAAALLLVPGTEQARAVSYKATIVSVAGYNDPNPQGISGTNIIGLGTPVSGDGGAYLVNDATHSVVELNPTGWSAQPNAVSGASQVGHGSGPMTGANTHAVLWHGTAASLVDLNPVGISNSFAYGVSRNNQVGAGYASGVPFHALLWHGTAASVVDLHPAEFTSSQANAAFENDIVGYGTNAGQLRALLWQGADHTLVNLHSAAYPQTYAADVSQDSQVGDGIFSSVLGGERHALLWHGTAASLIDLHPPGFTQTVANGVAGLTQVGYGQGTATGNKQHAIAWQGSAASYVDLHSLLTGLGHTFVNSGAADINENGIIVGYAGESNNTIYAVKWTPIVPGDYNGDALVDAADYTVWRDTLGSTSDLRANGDNTGASVGKIDEADYNFWRTNFGLPPGASAASTAPEPASLFLFALVLPAALASRSR